MWFKWIAQTLLSYQSKIPLPANTSSPLIKTNFFTVLALTVLLASVSSCQHTADEVKPVPSTADQLSGSTKSGAVAFANGTADELARALQALKANKSTLSQTSAKESQTPSYAEFDLSKVIIVQAKGVGAKAYVFKALDNTEEKQRVLAIYGYGQPDARPVVTETTRQAVRYIDYKNNVETVVTQNQGVIQVATNILTSQAGGVGGTNQASPTKSIVARTNDCQNDTNQCIADAYQNNGWISTWLFVQSAFIPATAAAVAADCALHNCFGTNRWYNVMKTLSFYALIVSPLLILAVLSKLHPVEPQIFTILILLYALVYHPTVVGKRLLSKHIINQSDFAKNYIPFWNMQYFSEAFT